MSKPIDVLRRLEAAAPDGVIAMPAAVRALVAFAKRRGVLDAAALIGVHELLAFWITMGGIEVYTDESVTLPAEDLALCPRADAGPVVSLKILVPARSAA